MESEHLTKEQRVLRMMRKVLANIIKDVTPAAGHASPLSEQTIADIKDCFGLISAREQELIAEQGHTDMRPFYPGEEPATKVVQLVRPKKDEAE